MDRESVLGSQTEQDPDRRKLGHRRKRFFIVDVKFFVQSLWPLDAPYIARYCNVNEDALWK